MATGNFESDTSCSLTDVELQELQDEADQLFQEIGHKALDYTLHKGSSVWQNIPIRIGVTGRPGVGKSSFINSIRGLDRDDEGAAETGVTEANSCIAGYSHPENKQFQLFDLPGAGTARFRRKTYAKDVNLSEYDMLVIVFMGRVCEDVLWLVELARKLDKPLLLVRSHVDKDVSQEKGRRKYEKSENPEQDVLETIRSEIISETRGNRVESENIFLIDCSDTKMSCFDGPKLLNHAIKQFPLWKKRAFVMTLTANNYIVIEEKVKMLRKQIFSQAIKAGVGGTLPIPFMGKIIDAALFQSTVQSWRADLHVSDEDIEIVAKQGNITTIALQNQFMINDWKNISIDDARRIFDLREHPVVTYAIKMIPGVSSVVEYNTFTICCSKLLRL